MERTLTKEEFLNQISKLVYSFEEERDNNPIGLYIDFGEIDETPTNTIYEWNGWGWKVSSDVTVKFAKPDPLTV